VNFQTLDLIGDLLLAFLADGGSETPEPLFVAFLKAPQLKGKAQKVK